MAYEPDPDYDASYDYRDLREGSRQGSTLWRTALIGAGVVIALVAVFFAYRSGQAPTAGDAPPLITADGGPIKVAPSEPGGMDIPNQDKLILNKGTSQPDQQVEQLLPPPEQPVLPTVEASSPVEPAIPAPPVPTSPVPASPAPAQTAALQPETPAMPATPAAPAAADAVAAVPVVPAAPTAALPGKASGAVMVQFAALKDKAAAEQAWTRLTKMHADLLGSLKPSIEPVTVNGNKLFRLRAVGLGDAKAASALCAKMKERKADCTVVR
jgi:hypothetical protein